MNWTSVVKINKWLELVKLGKITTLFPQVVIINFLFTLHRGLMNHKKWAVSKDKSLSMFNIKPFSKLDFKIKSFCLSYFITY